MSTGCREARGEGRLVTRQLRQLPHRKPASTMLIFDIARTPRRNANRPLSVPQRPDPEGFSGFALRCVALRCLVRIAARLAPGPCRLARLSAREARLARSENRLSHPTPANPAAPLTYCTPRARPCAQPQPLWGARPDAGLGRLLRARTRRGRRGADVPRSFGIVPSGPAKRWIAQPTPSHRRSQEVSDNDRTNFITTIARLGQCCCPCCAAARVALR